MTQIPTIEAEKAELAKTIEQLDEYDLSLLNAAARALTDPEGCDFAETQFVRNVLITYKREGIELRPSMIEPILQEFKSFHNAVRAVLDRYGDVIFPDEPVETEEAA